MATSKPLFAAPAAITCTINGLANAAAQQSAVVDMSSDPGWEDYISGTLITASGSLGSNPTVAIYAYAPVGDGTSYTGGASGSDAAFTIPTYWQPVKVAVVSINASNAAEKFGPIGLAQFFGGTMPKKFGLIFENRTGLAMNAAGNSVYHEKIQGSIG